MEARPEHVFVARLPPICMLSRGLVTKFSLLRLQCWLGSRCAIPPNFFAWRDSLLMVDRGGREGGGGKMEKRSHLGQEREKEKGGEEERKGDFPIYGQFR